MQVRTRCHPGATFRVVSAVLRLLDNTTETYGAWGAQAAAYGGQVGAGQHPQGILAHALPLPDTAWGTGFQDVHTHGHSRTLGSPGSLDAFLGLSVTPLGSPFGKSSGHPSFSSRLTPG